jgi:hypothetical protein
MFQLDFGTLVCVRRTAALLRVPCTVLQRSFPYPSRIERRRTGSSRITYCWNPIPDLIEAG